VVHPGSAGSSQKIQAFAERALRSSILKAGEGLGEVFGNPCKLSPTHFPPKTDLLKLLGEVLGEIFSKKLPQVRIWIEKKALFP
jgi:hypothetical protein